MVSMMIHSIDNTDITKRAGWAGEECYTWNAPNKSCHTFDLCATPTAQINHYQPNTLLQRKFDSQFVELRES